MVKRTVNEYASLEAGLHDGIAVDAEIQADEKDGIRFHSIVWTLGRYDAVALYEAPDEKAAMKLSIERGDYMEIETLVAVPVEEARKLVE